MKKFVSLYEIFNETLENPKSYYYDYNEHPFLYGILFEQNEADKFIKTYFHKGKKSIFITEKIYKPTHVVSTYFLGLIIYHNTNFKSVIDKYIDKNLPEVSYDGNMKFTYFWYLLSLYHDIGYAYEYDKNLMFLENVEDTEIYQKQTYFLDSKYTFMIESNRYKLETYENYHSYSRLHRNCREHGYIGGKLLYLRSKNNLENRYINYLRHNPNDPNIESFYSNDLHWSVKHLDIYRLLAFYIMEHNMWASSDMRLYTEYGIEELYIEDFRKINIDKEPLLFLLCMIDTIEPIKIIEKLFTDNKEDKLDEFLNNTYIAMEDQSIEFIYIKEKTYLYRTFEDKIR